MRILACFKIVPDVEHITPDELRSLRDGALDTGMFRRIPGPYDEAALENALRLADGVRARGGDAVLHAVTVGGSGGGFAAECFALGFDAVFRVPAEEPDCASPEFVAAAVKSVIARQAGHGGYDAVFMGRQTFPGESGQTPFLVAARCALPCVADVMDVSCVERGVSVRSRTDAGECSRVVTRPAVFVMGEAAHPYLRAATLREKLRARGRAEETCLSEPFSPVMGAGKRLRYLYEPREKHCHFIESGTMEAKTGVMWERYLREAALHENC